MKSSDGIKRLKAERDSFEKAWKDQAKDSIFYIQVNRNLQAANKRLTEQMEATPWWDKTWHIVSWYGIFCIAFVLGVGWWCQYYYSKINPRFHIDYLQSGVGVSGGATSGPISVRDESLDVCQSSLRKYRREILQKNETIRLQNERLKRYREIRGDQ